MTAAGGRGVAPWGEEVTFTIERTTLDPPAPADPLPNNYDCSSDDEFAIVAPRYRGDCHVYWIEGDPVSSGVVWGRVGSDPTTPIHRIRLPSTAHTYIEESTGSTWECHSTMAIEFVGDDLVEAFSIGLVCLSTSPGCADDPLAFDCVALPEAIGFFESEGSDRSYQLSIAG
ncbi:MAG: hypothetical protein AAGA93_16325 [Actinomycetota bacterium]